jgi:DNA-binding transcriptional ArsR family regulator
LSSPAFDLDQTLAALADPYRRRTVDLLRQGPRRASDLARELEVTSPAMSRHLRVLRRSGLVQEEHPEFDARVRIYSLRPGAIQELRQWLDEVEAMWTQQLSAFRNHIAGTQGGPGGIRRRTLPPDESGSVGRTSVPPDYAGGGSG